jgi:hypothetical protein
MDASLFSLEGEEISEGLLDLELAAADFDFDGAEGTEGVTFEDEADFPVVALAGYES